jgi:Uma2 family endonuclease
LVDGELLVTPSPVLRHQRAVRLLVVALDAYLESSLVGEVLTSPFDLELEPETIVQPDVFVVPLDEARRLDHEMPGRALLLAIEILSPGSARGDRGAKRRLYQRRVPEYWIVDLDAGLIERWRAADDRPEIVVSQLEWSPAGTSAPLTLDLSSYFARVAGASSQ